MKAPRRAQGGFLGVLILGPLVIALVMMPLTAQFILLKAEEKRRNEEVRLMLAKRPGMPAPAPRPIADDAILEGEAEAAAVLRF